MKKTIVFITHDLDEALRLGDRIALMKDGSIVQIGTPEEILINPANEYVEGSWKTSLFQSVDRWPHHEPRETIVSDRGPRVALKIMENAGISSLYIVDNRRD